MRRRTRRPRVRPSRRSQRTGLTRPERASQERRRRAHAHWVRVRGLSPRPLRYRVGFAAALVAGSALAGNLAGPALLGANHLDAIHVRGLVRLSADEVAAATGVPRGAPPAQVDPRSVANRLEEHVWIASARAVRLPTGNLLVEVRERVPVAVAPVGPESSLFFVDPSGLPFAPVPGDSTGGLPHLVPAFAATAGEVTAEFAGAVTLAHRLPHFGLALPTQVAITAPGDPEGFSLQLAGLPARFVLGRNALDDRLATLARLLATSLPEVVSAASVDLRFADHAVLRKRASSNQGAQAAAARGRATPSRTRPFG